MQKSLKNNCSIDKRLMCFANVTPVNQPFLYALDYNLDTSWYLNKVARKSM